MQTRAHASVEFTAATSSYRAFAVKSGDGISRQIVTAASATDPAAVKAANTLTTAVRAPHRRVTIVTNRSAACARPRARA